jgi:hypothetical protein
LTIQQSRIDAPKFFPYGPQPYQELLCSRFSRLFQQIDMLQDIIPPGAQDDMVRAPQVADLRAEDTGASRPVHGAFGDLVVRQERLQLLRNVGLPGTHVCATINDGIAKKDDTFVRHLWMPFAQTGTSGLPLTPSEHRPGQRSLRWRL